MSAQSKVKIPRSKIPTLSDQLSPEEVEGSFLSRTHRRRLLDQLLPEIFVHRYIVLVSVGVVKGFRPRELDKKQKSILEEELRKGIHKDVAVGIYTSDAVRDGAGYAADFESVFKKAGWYAFRASDPYDERDYENGVVLIGKGTGEPPTIDVLKEVFTKSGIKVETERTERSTIELKIGKDT